MAAQWSLSTIFYVSLVALLHAECCKPAFYLFVRHHNRATQRVFEKKIPGCRSLVLLVVVRKSGSFLAENDIQISL